jgi:ribosomal protein S18 acetylase RimI-like enzyme
MIIADATRRDCIALAATSKRAFDNDVHHGAPGPGGPPGYDSAEWHLAALRWGKVFSIQVDGELVGGAIVLPQPPRRANLGRIWLLPELQGRGLGAAAMQIIEARYPDVTTWTLETPVWNIRNQRFYAGRGYREVGRNSEEVFFEKVLDREPADVDTQSHYRPDPLA